MWLATNDMSSEYTEQCFILLHAESAEEICH